MSSKTMDRSVWRRLGVTGVISVAAVGLAACASAAGGAPASGGGGQPVGIAMEAQSNSFSVAAATMLVDNATEAGFAPLEPTDAGGDASKQIADIQSLIGRGAQGLLVVPWDSNALIDVVDRAVDQGIPVVAPNVGINSPKVYMNVRASSVDMGRMQCEALEGQLPEGASIFYEGGGFSDNVGKERLQGFSDCVAEKYPSFTITVKEGKWDPVTATNQIETAFGSGQKYDALILASDALYAPGAISTLKKLNLLQPVGAPGHIYLSSIDGSPEGLDAIRDDYMDFMVAQPLIEQNLRGVEYLDAALAGEERTAGPTPHGSEVVEENGVFTDILPAIGVTKENVDDDAIWGNSVE